MGRDVRRLVAGSLLLGLVEPSAAATLKLPNKAARARTTALIDKIDATLRDADSATLVLERWCAERRIAMPVRIVADREATADRPPTATQRALLGVAAEARLRYRKVSLACGTHILSQAENWYVPDRLTPAMNAALDDSDEPFGKVIRPLNPQRRTFAIVHDLGTGARRPPRTVPCDTTMFSHEALVLDGTGRPLALVAEHYKLEMICAIGAAAP